MIDRDSLSQASALSGNLGSWLISSEMSNKRTQNLRVQLKAVLKNTITKDTKSNGLDGSQAKTARNDLKKMLNLLSQ